MQRLLLGLPPRFLYASQRTLREARDLSIRFRSVQNACGKNCGFAVTRQWLTSKIGREIGYCDGAFLRHTIDAGVGRVIGIDWMADVARCSSNAPGTAVKARRFNAHAFDLGVDVFVSGNTLKLIQEVRNSCDGY